MGILSWILIGAVAGWLGSIIAGSTKKKGCIFNIALGIIGALVGGFVFNLLGGSPVTGFNLYSIFVATVGAIIVIWIAKKLG